jgi:hypothetical protein
VPNSSEKKNVALLQAKGAERKATLLKQFFDFRTAGEVLSSASPTIEIQLVRPVLEPEFANQFDVTSTLRHSRDCGLVRSTDLEVRLPERRMVECVGRVGAEVKRYTLVNLESLTNCKVDHVKAGAINAIATRVAEASGSRRRECGCVEPMSDGAGACLRISLYLVRE